MIGQLDEAIASLDVTISNREKTLQAFVTNNVEKDGDASRQADELEQQPPKAKTR
ncbi:MAG: hypothetical protein KGI75_14980 [Rhizobiaceae bacterium]|nr:hypothetical protein [Rhizobiaceae bacterium]